MIRIPSGQVVLLTRLCEGQHATVLQLPAPAEPDAKYDLHPCGKAGTQGTAADG